jgi:hypothetical protein
VTDADRHRARSDPRSSPRRTRRAADTCLGAAVAAEQRGPVTVEIVVPVHDEERDPVASIERLHAYLTGTFPVSFRITISAPGTR